MSQSPPPGAHGIITVQGGQQSTQSASQTNPVETAMTAWLECIHEWYPDLHARTHFFPPLHFNRVSYDIVSVADQSVLVPKPAPIQPVTTSAPLYPSHPCPAPLSGQPVAGRVWSPQPTTPAPLMQVYDSDIRDDAAMERALICLRALEEKGMMVISELNFRKYLDGQTDSISRAACSLLPRPADKDRKNRDGDFDIVVIHREYGVLVGEVKSVGADRSSVSSLNHVLMKKVERAVKQLDKEKAVMEHLLSDMGDIRVARTLILPFISSSELMQALTNSTTLVQALCQCTDSADVSQAVDRCLCSDHLAQPSTWWHNTLLARTPDPCMTPELYERLVARFCGPATTVEVPTASPPRKVIRCQGQAVAETGLRFSSLALTPTQIALLQEPEPRYMYLQGPPGCGKTVVLVLKALQWLNQGKTVYVVSISDADRAVSALLTHQLHTCVGAAAAAVVPRRVHRRCYDFFGRADDVSRAVTDLAALASHGTDVRVIMDEIDLSVRRLFMQFITEICSAEPTISVWATGLWCLDNKPSRPAHLRVETLTTALRCPYAVTREVQQSRFINDTDISRYSAPAQPVTLEGPSVRWLYHKGQPGHSEGDPVHCSSCADNIADILSELRVGQPGPAPSLQCRDVWILCGQAPSDTDVMMQRLRQRHPLPFRVMPSPLSDTDALDLALAATDEVIATDYEAVSGLERPVVIGIGTRVGIRVGTGTAVYGASRSHVMSRCTASLYFIEPHHPTWDE